MDKIILPMKVHAVKLEYRRQLDCTDKYVPDNPTVSEHGKTEIQE